ncbi:Re/Si-specific NAD(P)(+) transhydrogenase subunit alpha [candidate division KSB1 bacterium]
MDSEPKPLTVGVVKETFPGERRVALTPDVLPSLSKAGLEVSLESGAGEAAGYPDKAYEDKGAKISGARSEVFASADIILQVRALGANPEAGRDDLEYFKQDQLLIGLFEPLTDPNWASDLAGHGVTAMAMELMPRITRAQSMDVLSSQANIAGYKAVILAAGKLPKMFPMFITAAGTITPAHVFIIGAGVAGLQAIATARRLGAVVKAYDVRPAVKEEVESLGAKFVELELETSDSTDSGGYAREMDEQFYRKQRDMTAAVTAESDVVITTAAVPGKTAPILVTGEMVAGMKPGSVIVDLAAERGGNCELTEPDQTVVKHGVAIIGPANLPSTIPHHSSQMYAKNVSTFLLHLIKDGKLSLDQEDEITRETLIVRGGKIVHPRMREVLGLDSSTE